MRQIVGFNSPIIYVRISVLQDDGAGDSSVSERYNGDSAEASVRRKESPQSSRKEKSVARKNLRKLDSSKAEK